jgi:ketosteroid isomerase-like protein
VKDITDSLPQIIRDHAAAYNSHDLDALMATFAPDALVNDIQREFVGNEAICDWTDKEIIGPNVTMAVEQAFDLHGDVVVRARMDGDYDKTGLPDPLILTYYFTLRNGLITQQIILLNKENA